MNDVEMLNEIDRIVDGYARHGGYFGEKSVDLLINQLREKLVRQAKDLSALRGGYTRLEEELNNK